MRQLLSRVLTMSHASNHYHKTVDRTDALNKHMVALSVCQTTLEEETVAHGSVVHALRAFEKRA